MHSSYKWDEEAEEVGRPKWLIKSWTRQRDIWPSCACQKDFLVSSPTKALPKASWMC